MIKNNIHLSTVSWLKSFISVLEDFRTKKTFPDLLMNFNMNAVLVFCVCK